MYKVLMSRKVARAVATMPKTQQERLALLVDDIRQNGPVRANWPNYSILAGTNTHHCHLSHKWVACWVETEKGITVEVTYAGSRGSAPYAAH
jgi:hypothetical protein